MYSPHRLTLPTLMLAAAVLLAGCASATPSAATVTPPAGVPTATPEPDGGPGQITVSGDYAARFTPAQRKASTANDQVTLTLFSDDLSTGVTLFFPADLQPGTYDLGDLFHRAASDQGARFDTFQDGAVLSYVSTGGTLHLTRGGLIFSGDFTFTAANPPDGATTATVTGDFTDVSIGP